jgi:hypothetical protein
MNPADPTTLEIAEAIFRLIPHITQALKELTPHIKRNHHRLNNKLKQLLHKKPGPDVTDHHLTRHTKRGAEHRLPLKRGLYSQSTAPHEPTSRAVGARIHPCYALNMRESTLVFQTEPISDFSSVRPL